MNADFIPAIIAGVTLLLVVIARGFGREVGSNLAKRLMPSSRDRSVDESPKSKVDIGTYKVGVDIDINIKRGRSPKIESKSEDIEKRNITELKREKKIFVEGHTDKRILKESLDYFCGSENSMMYPCEVNIVQAEGAARMMDAVEWGAMTNDNFCVLLDNDSGGKAAMERLASKIDVEKVITVGYADPEAVVLEDLLPMNISWRTDSSRYMIKMKQIFANDELPESDIQSLKKLLWRINEILTE